MSRVKKTSPLAFLKVSSNMIVSGTPSADLRHHRNLAEAIQTFVGERGIRLSGGQRRRIGIARALSKQADVIIFNEATSSSGKNASTELCKGR